MVVKQGIVASLAHVTRVLMIRKVIRGPLFGFVPLGTLTFGSLTFVLGVVGVYWNIWPPS